MRMFKNKDEPQKVLAESYVEKIENLLNEFTKHGHDRPNATIEVFEMLDGSKKYTAFVDKAEISAYSPYRETTMLDVERLVYFKLQDIARELVVRNRTIKY